MQFIIFGTLATAGLIVLALVYNLIKLLVSPEVYSFLFSKITAVIHSYRFRASADGRMVNEMNVIANELRRRGYVVQIRCMKAQRVERPLREPPKQPEPTAA